ncbi:DUF2269 family protein [Anaerobacillus sp. MEB173]|uniref:DUF2269 family protein n=1 Tax=Anaerobacillus sp. MEB173 TaxID=3383345 RepID=UPI003F90C5A1
MTTTYTVLLAVHIIAAVCGLGATFALPIIMNSPRTVTQAKFALSVSLGIEKLAKVGSITLLITGLILGILSPHLFTEIWYIASLIIYVAVQPIVAVLIPKGAKRQIEILEGHQGEDLPEGYLQIGKQIVPYNITAQIAVVILIILMTVKPF